MRGKEANLQAQKQEGKNNIVAPAKVKLPQQLPLQLLYTTDYIQPALEVFKLMQRTQRGTPAHKFLIRVYRRLLTWQRAQLRERCKAISTYLILKSTLGDVTHFTPEQVPELAKLCDYKDIKTFHSNVKVLQSLQLIEYRNLNGFVAGWDKLCEVFGMNEEHMRSHYVTYGRSIETVLTRVAMQKKEQQCLNIALTKLHKTYELQRTVKGISGKSNLEAVNDLQERVFFNPQLSTLFEIDEYVLFEVCRGDSSLSYRLWSCLFGYKSIGGFAHVKRKLSNEGLIAVFKREQRFTLDKQSTSDLPYFPRKGLQSRSNCLGTGIYNRHAQIITFHKPDEIVYLSLNLKAA